MKSSLNFNRGLVVFNREMKLRSRVVMLFKRSILFTLLTIIICIFSIPVFAGLSDQYTFFNDTDNEYYSLSFPDKYPFACSIQSFGYVQPNSKNIISSQNLTSYYCHDNPTACRIDIHMSQDCSGDSIATISINVLNNSINWVQIQPHQPDQNYGYRVSYEVGAAGNDQDIHVSHTIFYSIDNNTYDVFNLNINSSCIVSTGSLLPRGSHPQQASDLWSLCKSNMTSCSINLYKTVKTNTGYSCGPLVANILLDVDHGVKEIHIEPTSQYQISSENAIPNISQQISISNYGS